MKHSLTACILLLSFSILGQKKVFNREFSIPDKTPVYVSYFGNLGIHPGAKMGLEYSLYLKEKTKEKKRKIKTIRKTLIFSPNISFYSHSNSHKGLHISGDFIWRRYTKRLYFFDVSLGLGYYQRFNSGTTYEVTASGIEEKKLSSRSYLSPAISYSFGKRFVIKETIPTEVFLRTNYHFPLFYNSMIGNELSGELGIRMSLNFGIKQGKIKTKIKNKLK